MAYLKKLIASIVLTALMAVFLYSYAEARSGCCSHHDGVCGCSWGRQVCCDGTLSPSCTCYSPPPPPPTIPKFPDMTATWTPYPNLNKTFQLQVTLNDSNPTQYSAVINKCKGCDPGPLVDFTNKNFIFNNLTSGVWYLNVKKKVDGQWTNTAYWTIEIPEWYKPKPTLPPFPTVTPTTKPTDKHENSTFYGLSTLAVISGIAYLVGRKDS